MVSFHGCCSTVSRPQNHYEETVYFLPPSPQEDPDTHLIDLGMMKGFVDPETHSSSEAGILDNYQLTIVITLGLKVVILKFDQV